MDIVNLRSKIKNQKCEYCNRIIVPLMDMYIKNNKVVICHDCFEVQMKVDNVRDK